MECTKDKIYFLIETLRRSDMNATEIHTIINKAWPDQCLSIVTIRRRCQEFRDETRMSFERKQRSDCRKSDTRNDNIQEVARLIDENNCITLRQITDILDISDSMCYRILNEDLMKKWRQTQWVPHTLSSANITARLERCGDMLDSFSSRQTQINLVTIDEKFFYCRKLTARNKIGSWISAAGDEPQRQTARRTNMEKKFMTIIAFSQKGFHYFEVLDVNEHINAERYIQFINNMIAFFGTHVDRFLPENMRLQQDNARPHTATSTMQRLEELNIRLIRQPPYSPDINLCDRYLFPRLEALTTTFASRPELESLLSRELPKFTAARMKHAL